jgi:fructose-bisphosphate aldolase class II
MPPTATRDIVERALRDGYAVPAINVVNDLTLEAVLAAAEAARSPIIVQTSAKTVRAIGVDVLFAMWQAMVRAISVPAALHLDHCPDRAVITACLRAGWQSVLFDGSALSVEENLHQCREVVAEAHALGAAVEGEIETIKGVEDDLGSEEGGAIVSQETAVRFIEETGVDIFAPAIGNAHGVYASPPVLDAQRVSDLVAATGIPMALHGGTGIPPEQFTELIARGCAKVNVSTALKLAYMESSREYLTQHPEAADPPTLFRHQRDSVMAMTRSHIAMFGSEGRA